MAFASGLRGTGPDSPAPGKLDWHGALQAYAERAATLRRTAIGTGTVSYFDVIDAAYGPGTISLETLEEKARWRSRVAAPFHFVTDYSTLLEAAAVGPLDAVADVHLQSTLVAQYESTSHTIGIAPMAADFAIFHEAGHALQRAALRANGSAQSRRPEIPDFLLMDGGRHRGIDPTTLHRLEYLCSQVEFEVRLQDLNRFHALLEGRPIMDPLDAVRALVALGFPLAYEETRDALGPGGIELSRGQFAACASAASPGGAAIAVAFEDARELRLVRTLALRADPGCWTRLLAKLIFEAPGHL